MSGSAIPIAMPKLGMTMVEGRVVAWSVAVGARVAAGEIVLVIESEKAEVEIESPAAGVLRHVYVTADRTVPCGTLLAALTPTADAPFDADAFRRLHDRPERVHRPVAAPELPSDPARRTKSVAPVTPAARALARERDVDLGRVVGTGPNGRITREDVEAFVAARERRVPVGGGVSLEVMVQGTGPTMLLVPGFGCDAGMFAPLVPALAAGHRVVAVNPRGVGSSDAPDGPSYALGVVAREVLATEPGRVHVVGASLGAAVALEMALAAPERVHALTLITPFVEVTPRLDAVLDAWVRVAAEASPLTLAVMLLPWLVAPERLADAGARRRTLRGLAETVSRVSPPSLGRHAAGLRAWSGSRAADLGAVAARTLVVTGADDLLTPDGRDVADAIPGARFAAIGPAGHAVVTEAADRVLAAMGLAG